MTTQAPTTSVPLSTLLEKFSDGIRWLKGPKESNISGLGHPGSAQPTDLILLSDREHIALAQKSRSRIWLVANKDAEEIQVPDQVTLLASANPKLMMAHIAAQFFRPNAHHLPVSEERISPYAVIDSSAKLGPGCKIGPGAVVGKDCVIGINVVIGALAVLENGVHIGDGTHIHPQVFIAHGTSLGKNCEVKPHSVLGGEGFGYATDTKAGTHHRITHFGRLMIGNSVHVGSGVQIDRGTFEDSRIDDEVKIDNLCHFGHNIEIGRGTIITGGVVTAGSVKIGKYCVIGGRTTISGHLTIADQVQIGGLSGVTKDIAKSGQYGGYPLQPLGDYLKTQSSLTSLPSLRRKMSRVLKALSLKEDE